MIKKNILIVENTKLTIKHIQAVLIEAEFNIFTVDHEFDKIDYIDFIKKNNIHLVILDIDLKNKAINGLDIATIIKTKLGLDFPVLILSLIVDKNLASKLQKIGCNDFLSKVCNEHELIENAQRLLENK